MNDVSENDVPELDQAFEFDDEVDRRDVPALKPKSALFSWLGCGALALLGLALLIAIWTSDEKPEKKADRGNAPRIDFNVPALTMPVFEKEPPPPAPVIEFIQPAAAAEIPSSPTFDIPPPATASLQNGSNSDSANEEETPEERRLNSPLSGPDTSGSTGAPLSNSTSGAPGTPVSASRSASPLGSRSGVDLSATTTVPSRARRLADLTFTIPKGTFANCTMTTAIQTDQPGFTECRLMRDLYGADGTVILLDKGSTVSGEYKPGSFQIGKERIAIVWSRIRTPGGVLVELASPGTGPLGRSGVKGWVDNHYGLRYGIPILISLINQAGQFASAASGTGGNQSQFFSTASGAVTQVLSENAQIAPTLTKNQGEIVSIIFSDDVDFSSVYQLSQR